MPNKKEFACDPATIDHLRVIHSRHDQTNSRPLTTLELLMQEAPGWEGRTGLLPIVTTLELRDVLADAIDSLPPENVAGSTARQDTETTHGSTRRQPRGTQLAAKLDVFLNTGHALADHPHQRRDPHTPRIGGVFNAL